MEMTQVPEINVADATRTPDAAAMALTGNTATDLANIAKELGVSLDASGNVAPAEAPTQPAPVLTPIPAQAQPQADGQPKSDAIPAQIPAKFQNPDGTVNEQRLEKSTQSIDEAIARYRVKEREFAQLQNKVNNPIPQAQPQTQAPAQLTAFEVQIAQDLLNESAAAGEPMRQAHAIAQARVMAKGLEAKYAAEMDATSDLRRRLEDNERSRELQGMIDGDASLMSADMVERLWAIRQENDYLNKAKEPWKAAYTFFKGTQQTLGGQVQTPNPTGQTAKAPPTPVGPVSRVQKSVNLESIADIKSLSDEELTALTKQAFPGLRATR